MADPLVARLRLAAQELTAAGLWPAAAGACREAADRLDRLEVARDALLRGLGGGRMENPLVGRVVVGVDLADDKHAIRFRCAEGEPVVARTDGDCCSTTWIEDLVGVEQIVGARVVSVEDVPMPDEDEGEIKHYACRVTSERGVLTIAFRNESNGYYGGNLSWPGDRHYYGGVSGQNVSTEQWVPVSVDA